MKISRLAAAAAFSMIYLLAACGSRPDAGVLLREAKARAASAGSCAAVTVSELSFTANGAGHSFRSKTELVYRADPFAVKSAQSSQNDGAAGNSETYTVTEDGRLSFYCKTPSGWQKSDAGDLDTSPAAQIAALRLLDETESQSYVRETETGSRKTHKIELKLKSEVLRGFVENIVTASGMANGSSTAVQALLDGAPAVYGYCYADAETGDPLRLELDAADALNQIFGNIDGSPVKISVSACRTVCDLSAFGSAPAVALPEEAKNASSVQAEG